MRKPNLQIFLLIPIWLHMVALVAMVVLIQGQSYIMEVGMQVGVMVKKIHKATYRFSDSVKRAVSTLAQIDSRSENLQVEYLIKLGSLVHEGIEPTKLSPKQIAEKFEELFGSEEVAQ